MTTINTSPMQRAWIIEPSNKPQPSLTANAETASINSDSVQISAAALDKLQAELLGNGNGNGPPSTSSSQRVEPQSTTSTATATDASEEDLGTPTSSTGATQTATPNIPVSQFNSGNDVPVKPPQQFSSDTSAAVMGGGNGNEIPIKP